MTLDLPGTQTATSLVKESVRWSLIIFCCFGVYDPLKLGCQWIWYYLYGFLRYGRRHHIPPPESHTSLNTINGHNLATENTAALSMPAASAKTDEWKRPREDNDYGSDWEGGHWDDGTSDADDDDE